MKLELITRPAFYICGYAVETTLEGNNNDIAALYRAFFETDKERELLRLGCQRGYYGLEWYTEGHKSFFYLLGKAVDGTADIPSGAVMKRIPAAQYAVAKILAGSNLIEAWTEFFYTAIPQNGYAPDEAHGFYFEYYPDEVYGRCELWTPVVHVSKEMS